MPEQRAKRIYCFGDSNTYGYDPRSYVGGRLPENVRWTGVLNASPDWEILERGANGRSVPDCAAEYAALSGDLRRSAPLDLFAVMLGTNDLLGTSAPDARRIAERMERMLDASASALSKTGAETLLVAPPQPVSGDWTPDCERFFAQAERLTRLYRELAGKRGIYFADAGEWGVGLAFDGVHFSPEGHAAFALGMDSRLRGIFR
jgi:lysophospholipase L1-like esterase